MRIHVPSYYGIFKAADIDFVDVKIDNRYEREDKQPDVIATTKEGALYLIEFTFEHKVQHKKDLDYNNLTCLEIDLLGQTLETLEEFLMISEENKRWINNENYFNQIEDVYRKANKAITLVDELSCLSCEIRNICCTVKRGDYSQTPIRILNNGQIYRMCKTEEYKQLLAERKKYLQEEQMRREEEARKRRKFEKLYRKQLHTEAKVSNNSSSSYGHASVEMGMSSFQSSSDSDSIQERSCFICVNNLSWGNRGGRAKCGISSINARGLIEPCHAKICKMFKKTR